MARKKKKAFLPTFGAYQKKPLIYIEFSEEISIFKIMKN
jgi:hypothetical protein